MSDPTVRSIGCLVMAAGNGARFGSNKLEASFAGKSLFSLALAAIPAGTFSRVTVVSQSPALLHEAQEAGCAAILNDRPEDGISRTIRLGTQALSDCDGILYLVADQPRLTRASLQKIADAWRAHPDRIAAAMCGERRGNPNLFPAKYFPELCALEGARGGTRVIRAHPASLLPVQLPERELADCDG